METDLMKPDRLRDRRPLPAGGLTPQRWWHKPCQPPGREETRALVAVNFKSYSPDIEHHCASLGRAGLQHRKEALDIRVPSTGRPMIP